MGWTLRHRGGGRPHLPRGGTRQLSGNSRNGTGAGGISIGGFSDSPISGGSKCTDFDGADDKITSGYTGCFTNGSPTTFEGWAKRDVRTAYHQIFGDAGSNSAGSLRVDQNSQQVTMNVTTGTPTWAGAWPRNGEWVHWVLVTDEGTPFDGKQSQVAIYPSLLSAKTIMANYLIGCGVFA